MTSSDTHIANSHPLAAGDQLGRYTLNKRIARGGMGDVWLATAHGTAGFEKRVVIKTVLQERADDALLIDLLKEEARVSARLDHPNLITVFDFGQDRGLHYLTMEYVAGRSLLSIMKQAQAEQRGIPTWFALKVLADCCKGLQYAHQQRKLVHCDLSPGNIMVCFTGIAKVVDFGVAHRSETGNQSELLRGKYRYMAPERIREQIVEPRGDVFSIGVILYLLLTGRFPFAGVNDQDLLTNIVAGHPLPPSQFMSVDSELESVVMRAIAHKPTERFNDAAGLLASLRSCLPQRDSNLPLEDDVAFFLASLFPYAEDIPQDVKQQLERHARCTGARMDNGVDLDEDSEPFSSIVFMPDDDSDASRTVVESLLRERERLQNVEIPRPSPRLVIAPASPDRPAEQHQRRAQIAAVPPLVAVAPQTPPALRDFPEIPPPRTSDRLEKTSVSVLFSTHQPERTGSPTSKTLFSKRAKPQRAAVDRDAHRSIFNTRPPRLGPERTVFGERRAPPAGKLRRLDWPVVQRPSSVPDHDADHGADHDVANADGKTSGPRSRLLPH